MTNILNICKIMYEKALQRPNSRSTSITEQETSIATNLLTLLEDLSNSDSFTLESEDSLEIFDCNNSDPD